MVVYITCPSAAVGTAIATSLVDARHAACVTRLPGVASTYRWNDAITTDAEELLMAKTTAGSLAALTAHVLAAHPYEVPEVVALPVVGGNHKYLAWVRECVGQRATVSEGEGDKWREGPEAVVPDVESGAEADAEAESGKEENRGGGVGQ